MVKSQDAGVAEPAMVSAGQLNLIALIAELEPIDVVPSSRVVSSYTHCAQRFYSSRLMVPVARRKQRVLFIMAFSIGYLLLQFIIVFFEVNHVGVFGVRGNSLAARIG